MQLAINLIKKISKAPSKPWLEALEGEFSALKKELAACSRLHRLENGNESKSSDEAPLHIAQLQSVIALLQKAKEQTRAATIYEALSLIEPDEECAPLAVAVWVDHLKEHLVHEKYPLELMAGMFGELDTPVQYCAVIIYIFEKGNTDSALISTGLFAAYFNDKVTFAIEQIAQTYTLLEKTSKAFYQQEKFTKPIALLLTYLGKRGSLASKALGKNYRGLAAQDPSSFLWMDYELEKFTVTNSKKNGGNLFRLFGQAFVLKLLRSGDGCGLWLNPYIEALSNHEVKALYVKINRGVAADDRGPSLGRFFEALSEKQLSSLLGNKEVDLWRILEAREDLFLEFTPEQKSRLVQYESINYDVISLVANAIYCATHDRDLPLNELDASLIHENIFNFILAHPNYAYEDNGEDGVDREVFYFIRAAPKIHSLCNTAFEEIKKELDNAIEKNVTPDFSLYEYVTLYDVFNRGLKSNLLLERMSSESSKWSYVKDKQELHARILERLLLVKPDADLFHYSEILNNEYLDNNAYSVGQKFHAQTKSLMALAYRVYDYEKNFGYSVEGLLDKALSAFLAPELLVHLYLEPGYEASYVSVRAMNLAKRKVDFRATYVAVNTVLDEDKRVLVLSRSLGNRNVSDKELLDVCDIALWPILLIKGDSFISLLNEKQIESLCSETICFAYIPQVISFMNGSLLSVTRLIRDSAFENVLDSMFSRPEKKYELLFEKHCVPYDSSSFSDFTNFSDWLSNKEKEAKCSVKNKISTYVNALNAETFSRVEYGALVYKCIHEHKQMAILRQLDGGSTFDAGEYDVQFKSTLLEELILHKVNTDYVVFLWQALIEKPSLILQLSPEYLQQLTLKESFSGVSLAKVDELICHEEYRAHLHDYIPAICQQMFDYYSKDTNYLQSAGVLSQYFEGQEWVLERSKAQSEKMITFLDAEVFLFQSGVVHGLNFLLSKSIALHKPLEQELRFLSDVSGQSDLHRPLLLCEMFAYIYYKLLLHDAHYSLDRFTDCLKLKLTLDHMPIYHFADFMKALNQSPLVVDFLLRQHQNLAVKLSESVDGLIDESGRTTMSADKFQELYELHIDSNLSLEWFIENRTDFDSANYPLTVTELGAYIVRRAFLKNPQMDLYVAVLAVGQQCMEHLSPKQYSMVNVAILAKCLSWADGGRVLVAIKQCLTQKKSDGFVTERVSEDFVGDHGFRVSGETMLHQVASLKQCCLMLAMLNEVIASQFGNEWLYDLVKKVNSHGQTVFDKLRSLGVSNFSIVQYNDECFFAILDADKTILFQNKQLTALQSMRFFDNAGWPEDPFVKKQLIGDINVLTRQIIVAGGAGNEERFVEFAVNNFSVEDFRKLSGVSEIAFWKRIILSQWQKAFSASDVKAEQRNVYNTPQVFWHSTLPSRQSISGYILQALSKCDLTINDLACVFAIAKAGIDNVTEVGKILEEYNAPSVLVRQCRGRG
jgi:hypothetical protein